MEVLYDRRSARFAEFFDQIAEGVPVEKIARLKDYIQSTMVVIILNCIFTLNMKIRTVY